MGPIHMQDEHARIILHMYGPKQKKKKKFSLLCDFARSLMGAISIGSSDLFFLIFGIWGKEKERDGEREEMTCGRKL